MEAFVKINRYSSLRAPALAWFMLMMLEAWLFITRYTHAYTAHHITCLYANCCMFGHIAGEVVVCYIL